MVRRPLISISMRFRQTATFSILIIFLLDLNSLLAFIPVQYGLNLRPKSDVPNSYASRPSLSFNRLSMQEPSSGGNFFSKFARTILEKAKADVERTKRLFQGLELIRSDMSVIDELLSFWNLDEADTTLEKLEEALITRDFGVSTASKICDALREDVKAGVIRDPRYVN